MRFFNKLKGDGVALPPKPSAKVVALTWLGRFLAIGSVAVLGEHLNSALVLGSFGTSCVLVFVYPDVLFS